MGAQRNALHEMSRHLPARGLSALPRCEGGHARTRRTPARHQAPSFAVDSSLARNMPSHRICIAEPAARTQPFVIAGFL
jgi:hypothetical protein